jgi:hypothetical protein
VLELRSQFLMEMDQVKSRQYGVLAPDIDYERIVQILRQFLFLFNIKF